MFPIPKRADPKRLIEGESLGRDAGRNADVLPLEDWCQQDNLGLFTVGKHGIDFDPAIR